MKATVPALIPLSRSNTQHDILALLFMNEGEEYSLADISQLVGALPATVRREVDRLVAPRILTVRKVGRTRLVRANHENPQCASLFDLLLPNYGPQAVLEPLLVGVPGVEHAFIYGSWAARYQGEVGAPPQDVDVLVVGTTPREHLEGIAREAQVRLRREVNVSRVSSEEWQKATQPFVSTIKSRALVELDVTEHPPGVAPQV